MAEGVRESRKPGSTLSRSASFSSTSRSTALTRVFSSRLTVARRTPARSFGRGDAVQDQRKLRKLEAERAEGRQYALARGVPEIRHHRVDSAPGHQVQQSPGALTETHRREGSDLLGGQLLRRTPREHHGDRGHMGTTSLLP